MVTSTNAITNHRLWRRPRSPGTRRYLLTGVFTVGIVLAAAATASAVTLVEPGHSLNLIADSVAPLHPSQLMLGTYASTGIESITVDDATGNIYVQVMGDGHTGCPSNTTAIYQISPAGVTIAVNAATGFGICERGSDIDIDPASGLLVAQNANAGPNGEIATVMVPGGALGTWVIPSVFTGNTFGMEFAPGIGVVPAGDIVYAADIGADINSAPFGGPNVNRATPPTDGDDLYIQPDGDIIFIGEFDGGIHIYNPTTFASVAAAVPGLQTMFNNAGLNFIHGTRATDCPDGEGFVSFSGGTGGTGVFRLNEPVTASTLVLTMASDEGIHDISVGPSTSGAAGRLSLFMTVENYTSGAHQVWEVTDVCAGAGLPTKWDQPIVPIQPDNIYYGWNEESTWWSDGPTVADDWVCDTDEPVKDIHWWGSFEDWRDDLPPYQEIPTQFHILFWTDVPGDGTTNGFSHPGEVIHEIICDDFDYTFVGYDYDPRTGKYESCFRFDQYLTNSDDWFYQDPTGTETIYWISISAGYNGMPPGEHPWGWKTRPRDPDSPAPDDAVVITDPPAPGMGSQYVDGSPIYWPDPEDSWDMAFELTTSDPQTPSQPDLKWDQPPMTTNGSPYPGCFWGWDERSVYYSWPPFDRRDVADDWLCTNGLPVTDVHWWGSYKGWLGSLPPTAGPDRFLIEIWTDVPADGTTNGFSHPGQRIWQGMALPADVTETYAGCDYYGPPDGSGPHDSCFYYTYQIPEANWFYQQPGPHVYWISITAEYSTVVPQYEWGWKTRKHHFNDDAVRIFDRAGGWFLDGEPIEDPPGTSWDMAFQLTTSVRLKWSQPPVLYDEAPYIYAGWNVQSVYDPWSQIVADDWVCTNGAPVTDIHWWGSFLAWAEEEPPTDPDPALNPFPLAFHIGIWKDAMCNDPVYGDFSCPGEMVWENYCDTFTWQFVGWDMHPSYQSQIEAVYRFEQVLDEKDWFYQDADTNSVYWISISSVHTNGYGGPYHWGWKTRPHYFQDDAVTISNPVQPGLHDSVIDAYPIEYPTGVSWDMAFRLTTQDVEPQPDTFLIEFSLDIGSDTELSDPNRDGDEGFDPGDVYWWRSDPVTPPDVPDGRDGFKDDYFIFGPMGFGDVWPDPPDPLYTTAVPVGDNVNYPPYVPDWFDLDGHDQLDFSLEPYGLPDEPRELKPVQLPHTQCIYYPEFLVISFEDDMPDGWPAFDVPVTVSSAAGFIYGTTPGNDEILEMTLDISVAAPYPILVGPLGIADEVSIHTSLRPNPDAGDPDDDDVDSLDIVCSTGQCPYWYFSPDHEAPGPGPAGGMLDPGDIYLVTAAGPVLVIDGQANLGLLPGTDVDAFEFAWVKSPSGGVRLAVLFSVDEDDPLTFFPPVNESGGLNPAMIYYSFLNGSYSPLLDVELWDDVDALTNWHDELGDLHQPQAPPEFAADDPVRSWKNHNTAAVPNWLYIAFPPTATAQFVGVETRLYRDANHELELTVSFNKAVQVPALADIVLCGCAHGPYNPSSIVADSATTLRMIFQHVPNGEAGIEDGLADRYQLYLGEVKDLAGNAMKNGPDDDVEFILQVGNVNETGPPLLTRNRTDLVDYNNVFSNIDTVNPTTQATAKYDVKYFGPPALTRNHVDLIDCNTTFNHISPGPVCAFFSPAAACPSPPW